MNDVGIVVLAVLVAVGGGTTRDIGNVDQDWGHCARLIWPHLLGVVWWSGVGRSGCRLR